VKTKKEASACITCGIKIGGGQTIMISGQMPGGGLN